MPSLGVPPKPVTDGAVDWLATGLSGIMLGVQLTLYNPPWTRLILDFS
jgi:hypothetical protein